MPTAKKSSQQKLPTLLPSGKKDASFFEQVYDVVRQIPKGRVTSYGAVAVTSNANVHTAPRHCALAHSSAARPSLVQSAREAS